MKCNECKNFKEEKHKTENTGSEKNSGICAINNTVCDPSDECKTGLFDKTGAI
jgi:hypothetical protein